MKGKLTLVWTLLLVFTLHNGDQLKQRLDTYSTLKECLKNGITAMDTLKRPNVKAQCVSKEGALL